MLGVTQAATGRYGKVTACTGHGRYVRACPLRSNKRKGDIAVDATLRAVAQRVADGDAVSSLPPRIEDLRVKLRQRSRRGLVVFVLDASDSLAMRERMAAAKGAVLSLLTPAYQHRDRVALVVFRNASAEVLLPPTGAIALARRYLRQLPTGGATPLAEGLYRARRLIHAERRKDPHLVATLVLISDGDANVSFDRNRDCQAELSLMAARIRDDAISAVAIDVQPRSSATAPMRQIAKQLGARYHHIDDLRASATVG